MGKGEIARYEQFLLFPQCFRNLQNEYLWSKINNVCEGENGGNEQFLLFPKFLRHIVFRTVKTWDLVKGLHIDKSETLLEKEKMLVTSIFPVSYYVFVSNTYICRGVNPFPEGQILDASKLKGLADDNFKFEENSRKLPKWEENTAGKGEIARHEQFLLFPQCFQKDCTADT